MAILKNDLLSLNCAPVLFAKGECVIVNLTRQDFLDKIFDYEDGQEWKFKGSKPCLIEFGDNACPPCKAISPILSELDQEFHAQIHFYHVDITVEKDLAQELGIRNLPTLVLCPLDDKPVVIQGAAPKKIIAGKIKHELLT